MSPTTIATYTAQYGLLVHTIYLLKIDQVELPCFFLTFTAFEEDGKVQGNGLQSR